MMSLEGSHFKSLKAQHLLLKARFSRLMCCYWYCMTSTLTVHQAQEAEGVRLRGSRDAVPTWQVSSYTHGNKDCHLPHVTDVIILFQSPTSRRCPDSFRWSRVSIRTLMRSQSSTAACAGRCTTCGCVSARVSACLSESLLNTRHTADDDVVSNVSRVSFMGRDCNNLHWADGLGLSRAVNYKTTVSDILARNTLIRVYYVIKRQFNGVYYVAPCCYMSGTQKVTRWNPEQELRY